MTENENPTLKIDPVTAPVSATAVAPVTPGPALRILAILWRVLAVLLGFAVLANFGYAFMNAFYPVKILFLEWPEALSLWSWAAATLLWPLPAAVGLAALVLLVVRLVRGRPLRPVAWLVLRSFLLCAVVLALLPVGLYENFRKPNDPSFLVAPYAALQALPQVMKPGPEDEDEGATDDEPVHVPDAAQLFLRP